MSNDEIITRGEMPASPCYAGGHGMTIRERFAMAAMQGLCANPAFGEGHTCNEIAHIAVCHARSLLEELE